MRLFKRNEKGFTLVELLVAIPIMGLLSLAMGAVLIQLLHSDRISQRMVAVRQVQAAGDKVSQDGVQAQYVTFGDDMTDDEWSLNLTFGWESGWMTAGPTTVGARMSPILWCPRKVCMTCSVMRYVQVQGGYGRPD